MSPKKQLFPKLVKYNKIYRSIFNIYKTKILNSNRQSKNSQAESVFKFSKMIKLSKKAGLKQNIVSRSSNHKLQSLIQQTEQKLLRINYEKNQEMQNKMNYNLIDVEIEREKTDNEVLIIQQARLQGKKLLEILVKKQNRRMKTLNKIFRIYCTKGTKLYRRKEQQIIQAVPRILMEVRECNKRQYEFDVGKLMKASLSGSEGKQEVIQVQFEEEDYY